MYITAAEAMSYVVRITLCNSWSTGTFLIPPEVRRFTSIPFRNYWYISSSQRLLFHSNAFGINGLVQDCGNSIANANAMEFLHLAIDKNAMAVTLTGTSPASIWVLGPITLNNFKHECTAGTHWNFIKALKGPTVENSSQHHCHG